MSAASRGRSRRAWGWHRLTDEWAARIVADAGIRPGALVLDLGAGTGALTSCLADAGARVVAVEAHPARAEILRARFAGRSVTVVTGDALAMPLPRRPFRVVSNPPYSIAAPLLRMLLAPESRLVGAHIVLRRAVARRYEAGEFRGARRWNVRSGMLLPRRAFVPPPPVDSAVLVVRRRLGCSAVSQQPEMVYIIRHGEKPADPKVTGVDFHGGPSEHSLLPRGWQRSGALVTLFDPGRGGLRTPDALLCPGYGHPHKNAQHRTYQTLLGLSERFGLPIVPACAEGDEASLASSLMRDHEGVVLICWDHAHIPALATALPVAKGTTIPRKWPQGRFDIVWAFSLVPGSTRYSFEQIPQRLLAGDADTVITT